MFGNHFRILNARIDCPEVVKKKLSLGVFFSKKFGQHKLQITSKAFLALEDVFFSKTIQKYLTDRNSRIYFGLVPTICFWSVIKQLVYWGASSKITYFSPREKIYLLNMGKKLHSERECPLRERGAVKNCKFFWWEEKCLEFSKFVCFKNKHTILFICSLWPGGRGLKALAGMSANNYFFYGLPILEYDVYYLDTKITEE